jgi:hypothetical protein
MRERETIAPQGARVREHDCEHGGAGNGGIDRRAARAPYVESHR